MLVRYDTGNIEIRTARPISEEWSYTAVLCFEFSNSTSSLCCLILLIDFKYWLASPLCTRTPWHTYCIVYCRKYRIPILDGDEFYYFIARTVCRNIEIILTRVRIGHKRLTHSRICSHLFPLNCDHCALDTPLSLPDIFNCPALAPLRISHQIPSPYTH